MSRWNNKLVILFEWISGRGEGVLTTAASQFGKKQLGKFNWHLDEIEKFESLEREIWMPVIEPFDKELKQLKINGELAIRLVLAFGPQQPKTEITFLDVFEKKDNKPPAGVKDRARKRLQEVTLDSSRRRKYERPAKTAPRRV